MTIKIFILQKVGNSLIKAGKNLHLCLAQLASSNLCENLKGAPKGMAQNRVLATWKILLNTNTNVMWRSSSMQQNIWQHIGIVYIPQSVKPAVLKIIILNKQLLNLLLTKQPKPQALWASSLGQASLDIKLWM